MGGAALEMDALWGDFLFTVRYGSTSTSADGARVC